MAVEIPVTDNPARTIFRAGGFRVAMKDGFLWKLLAAEAIILATVWTLATVYHDFLASLFS
jgi:hypothetical protein